MRNLFALVGFIVVMFAGLGWYFNWYNFTVKASTDGKVNVSGDVDTKKITEDAKKFGEKVNNAIQNTTAPHPDNFVGPPAPVSESSSSTKSSGPIQLQVPGPKR